MGKRLRLNIYGGLCNKSSVLPGRNLVQHCIINSEFCEVVLDSLTVWFLNLDSDRVEH